MTRAEMPDARRKRIDEDLQTVRYGTGATTLPQVLLPYQQRLLALTAREQFVVCEKSRRIGMTWAVAADAVLSAGAGRSAGGMDVLYIGYNLDMAREFIDTAAMWARAFVPAAGAVQEFLFADQDEHGESRDIAAFRIRFASGFEIVALTSKPRSLRGRQGYVIFDEAAFHDALEELLKAAFAMLIWGGKVLAISTHDGVENPFNELVQEVRSGKQPGQVLKVTFDDAIADGLYERIALIASSKGGGIEPKAEWVAKTYAYYGDKGDEELRVIPRAGSGVYLTRAAIEACMSEAGVIARLTCPDGFELRSPAERNAYFGRWIEDQVAPGLALLDPARIAAIGGDFGRVSDLSVFPVGQELADMSIHVPLVVELRNCPIAQQQQVLGWIIRHIRRFGGASLDATGNGLGLAENLQEEFSPTMIEAVKITSAWYLETMPKLKGHIEDRSFSFPRDGELRDDLRSIRLVRGVPSIPNAHSGGRHGDGAVAFAMLVHRLGMDVSAYEYEAAPGMRSRYAKQMDDFWDDDDAPMRARGAW